MNEIQSLQYEMLIKLDEICHRHNLRYYLAFGTCIGAMREKGFIPWDHDVDVLMPIEDARKLSKYQNEFGERFFVSNYRTDPTFRNTNMRIVDRSHKWVVRQNGKVVENGFVCMDIYPFYHCPPTRTGLLMNIWRSHVYKMIVMGPPKNHGTAAKIISKVILLFFSEKNRERDIRYFEKKLDYRGRYSEIADYFGRDISFCSAITYKKEWFGKPKKLMFEGRLFDGPTYPEAYLARRYGDFKTPPPQSEIKNELVCELVD